MTEQYTDLADLSPEEIAEAKELGLISDEPETPNAEPEESTDTPAEPEPAPVPPQEDVEGEADEDPAPPTEDDKRTVPLKALHEEREKRKKLQAEADEREKRYLAAVEQNRLAMVKLAEFAERTAPKAPEPKAPEPEPEEEDPLEVMMKGIIDQHLAPLKQTIEQEQQEKQMKAVQARIDTCEAQARQQFSDYDEVTKPVFEELTRAAAAAKTGDQQAAAWLNSILASPNPPLAAYINGKSRNMTAAPVAPAPAPKTKTPPVVPRASGGGNGPGASVTAEQLLAMSTQDFDAWCSKHPKEARRLMGG